MNHLNLNSTHASGTASTPSTVVAGAHVLTIAHDSPKLWWRHAHDEASATINHGDHAVALHIKEALRSPIVIANHTDNLLVITMEHASLAHFVVLAQGAGRIQLNVLKEARAYLYVVPEHDHEFSLEAEIGEQGHLSLFEFGFGGGESSRTMTVTLCEPKAAVAYFGLDQLSGLEQKHSRLVIKHQGPETKSSQWFRGIYGGQAQGDFLGQVVIEKDAHGSSAQQLYKSVLLSEKAKAHAKPELVIFNHDISASHGATIGELDEEALFYLRSRGVPLQDAKAMLIESFIEEALLTIDVPELRHALLERSANSTARLLGDC